MYLYIDQFQSWLNNYSYANNSGWNLFLAFGIFVGISIVLYIFRKIVLMWLKNLSAKTENKLDDIFTGILQSIGPFTYPVFALYISLYYLNLPDIVTKAFSFVFVVVLAMEIIKAFGAIFDFYTEKYLDKLSKESEKKGTKSVMQIIKIIGKAILWVVFLLLILSNLGVNVTSVVASLGIGGLAIALAVQNILGDLLSSFSIYIDKPFSVGDFIVVGTDKGEVEKIGLKTTRIRSLSGEELIISNKELTSVRINNFKRLKKRRETFVFGLDYDTDVVKLKKVPEIIEQIIGSVRKLEFVRCRLTTLADYSLQYTVIFEMDSSDYEEFATVKQDVLLSMLDKFRKEKINFAYPTQEVIVKK